MRLQTNQLPKGEQFPMFPEFLKIPEFPEFLGPQERTW
jgi:hypothetical protein